VFWDQRCLNDAANWREGFLNGLKGSRIIILLISVGSLSRFASATASSQDNLLLEYEEALEMAKAGGIAVFPIFIGESKEVSAEFSHVDGAKGTEKQNVYFPFSFSHASLDKFPTLNHSISGKAIRNTLSQIFSIQGANYYPKAVNHLAKQLRDLLQNLEEQAINKLKHLVLSFEKIELPGIFLQRLSMKELNLYQANLKKATLPLANFEDAICTEADFSEAFLQGANFNGADLSGATFDHTDCSGIWDENQFKRASFSALKSIPSKFFQTSFVYAAFSDFGNTRVKFDSCNLTGAKLEGEFSATRFVGTVLRNVQFKKVNFGGDLLRWKSDCSDSYFEGCTFESETVPEAKNFTGKFQNCKFVKSKLNIAFGREFTNCKFVESTFANWQADAKFEGCEFTDCIFSNIKTSQEGAEFKFDITKSRLAGCTIEDSQFSTFADIQVTGKTVWKVFNVDHLLNISIGLPPLKYVSSKDVHVSKQPTTLDFKAERNTFKKVTGLRSSGVIWEKKFPEWDYLGRSGEAVLSNCKFKFYEVQQAKEFANRFTGRGREFPPRDPFKGEVVLKQGADGTIKEPKWEGHTPSFVFINSGKDTEPDDLFVK